MPLTNAYATVAQLREHMTDGGSKLDLELLERALNATSRAIDKFCGKRRFWRDASVVQRTYRPRFTDHVMVDDISTRTGVIVASDETGDGTYSTTWTVGTDYVLEPRDADTVAGGDTGDAYAFWRIDAVGTRTFTPDTLLPSLRVTARFGWSAVPIEVEEACLLKATKLFRRKDSPDGFSGFSEFGPVRISRFEDPDVVDLLDTYVRFTRPDV